MKKTIATIAAVFLLPMAGCVPVQPAQNPPEPVASQTAAPASRPSATEVAPTPTRTLRPLKWAERGIEPVNATWLVGVRDEATIALGPDPKSGVAALVSIGRDGRVQGKFGDTTLTLQKECGLFPTVADGQATASTVAFRKRPAEGVKAATYDVVVITLNEKVMASVTEVATGLTGEKPACTLDADRKPGSFQGAAGSELNWRVAGSTADGRQLALAQGRAGNTPDRVYMSDVQARTTAVTHRRPDRLVGNVVTIYCDEDNKNAKCVTRGDNVIQLAEEWCSTYDANCGYVSLPAHPDGLVVLTRGRLGSQPTTALVDPVTGKKSVDIKGKLVGAIKGTFSANNRVVVLEANNESGAIDSAGKELWSVPNAKVCGLTSDGVILSANRQVALLDPVTGDQRAYTDEITTCPLVSQWGLGWTVHPSASGSGLMVGLRPS